VAETASSFTSWALEIGREVPANPLTELKPVHKGVQSASSLAVVFERMGANYSADSVLGSAHHGGYRDD
jgi:hypothetical protein